MEGVKGGEGRGEERERRQNLSCASMKGQFIRSCSGRQNILPQCFTDCLDEEWEHISAVPGPGLGQAGAEAGAAPTWHSPITVCCKHPWGSWFRGTWGWRGRREEGREGGVRSCSDGGDGGNVGEINPDTSTKENQGRLWIINLFRGVFWGFFLLYTSSQKDKLCSELKSYVEQQLSEL